MTSNILNAFLVFYWAFSLHGCCAANNFFLSIKSDEQWQVFEPHFLSILFYMCLVIGCLYLSISFRTWATFHVWQRMRKIQHPTLHTSLLWRMFTIYTSFLLDLTSIHHVFSFLSYFYPSLVYIIPGFGVGSDYTFYMLKLLTTSKTPWTRKASGVLSGFPSLSYRSQIFKGAEGSPFATVAQRQ